MISVLERTVALGKLLVFCSGKGGVGKSTVAATLAIAAAQMGYSTLLIEADAGLRCLDLMLGVSDRLVFDLFDVVCAGRDADDAAIRCDTAGKLRLISAPASKCAVPAADIVSLAAKQTAENDYVMLDCPAGIDAELFAALPRETGVVVVTNPQAVPLRDAENLRRVAAAKSEAQCFLVINRFNKKAVKKGRAIGIDDAMDITGIKLLGAVPEDSAVTQMDGTKFVKSRAVKAGKRIIRRIEGVPTPLPRASRI